MKSMKKKTFGDHKEDLQMKKDSSSSFEDIFMKVNPPRAGASVDVDASFLGIFETIVVKDIEGTYKHLMDALKVGEEGFNDISTIRKALNGAEYNARMAHSLFLTARLHRKRFEIEHLPIVARMREEARELLEKELRDGLRKKAITIDEVTQKAAAVFNDEFIAEEMREQRAKAIEESMDNLAEVWKRRCSSLTTMLTMARKT